MRRTHSSLAVWTIVALVAAAFVRVHAWPVPTQPSRTAARPTATIQTDQEDYPPDTPVVVTGSGWLPREVVALIFTEIATTPPGGYTDGPFTFYANADAMGNITNGDFYTDEHDIGVVFALVATGTISGRTARTTFTDGVATLSQCANGSLSSPDPTPCQSGNEWVNGNLGASKSTYYEGDSIPYKLAMTGLVVGAIHTATIEWDTTKSGKHALDYLTTYNRSADAYPCAGVSSSACTPLPGTAATASIPADAQVTGSGVTPVAGDFTLFGGVVTAVSPYAYADGTGFAGDKSARITVSFRADVANPVLAWGGHIATRLDWGEGSSAVAISGSPYHMRLIDVDGSGGNQDRSLSADAVIFPGSITVVKQATPEGPTSFGFAASPVPLASFNLVDDGSATDTRAFTNIIDFTTYTISESSIPTTWGFDGVSCSVASPNGGSWTASSATVTIAMKEGERYTCAYRNSLKTGGLTVIKRVINDNGGLAAASSWSIHVKAGSTEVTGSPQAGQAAPGTFYTLVGGSYTVSETGGPTGYAMTGFSGDCDASGVVTVLAGQNKTCTIINDDQPASLTIVKRIVNDSGGSKVAGDFGITAAGTALTFGVVASDGANTLKYTATTLTGLSAGTTSLHENVVAGYMSAAGWSCVGASGAVGSNPQTGSVTLGNGDTVTCTITNDDQAATLTIVKKVIRDNGGTRGVADFGISTTAGALAFDSGSTQGSITTYTAGPLSVSAGTKTLHENSVTGYTSGTWGCTGAAGAVNADPQNGSVAIANGETVTCTITNDDQPASLTIVKRIVNDNGGTKVVGDFGITAAGSTLTFGAGTSDGPSTLKYTAITLSGLSAGVKALHENVVAGYSSASGWTCQGAAGSVVANPQSGSVVVGNGESVTCTITNDDAKASPTGSTAQSAALSDTITLIGWVPGGGQTAVTFYLYSDANCSALVGSAGGTLNGSAQAQTATGIVVPGSGTYYWKVTYAGDSYNNPFTSSCGGQTDERTVVTISGS